jgi:class 3 adenylate cyclase/tetratricopeptide (TPR) repeat protein
VVRICPSCSEPNGERARFCQACGAALPAPAEPAGDVRKVVTIVFADMVGSTQIGEALDPEALRRIQGSYFDTLATAIEAHGGTVEKYIGDAVMAVFGIPRVHEDDALRAVRAAVAMQTAISGLNDAVERDHGLRIAVRIGLNTGEVVAGDPSAGQRLVTGDAVNVAARLEQAASPGEILIAVATHQLVRDAVEVEAVEPLALRGKSERVGAFRLVTVLADSAGHARHLDSPMVGRTTELDLVRRGLDRARSERTSYLFTLLGSAGVGKSRLIREFLDRVQDATVLRGRCLSYGDGITFYAMGEIVGQVAGITEADDPATAIAKLSAVLSGAEDGDRIGRLVGGLFGRADPSTAEDASWAMRKLFEHVARERPLVLVIDDIHWAEPLLLDLIEYLADWTRDAMLLLLCVARPELLEMRPGWGGGKLNATAILLEPLGSDEAGALLENLLGGANLPKPAYDRILAAAEGNPLFVEEMLGMLIDDGLLRREDGGWRAAADLADLTVPPTIQLLLAARLDRLEAEERAVIERGAVEGKVFHTGAIASLTPEGHRAQVRPRLLALARKELIRPDRAEFAGEDAFRFRHMLIRDAAYEAMPKEQRAELHEKFARWLTQTLGDRMAEYREILGYHLERAYRFRTELGPIDARTQELGREAGRALRASAERAQARGDGAGAARLLERSATLLDGFERAEALLDLGENLVWSDQGARARDVLRDFIASADAVAWPGLRIRARVFLTFAEASTDPSRSQQTSHDEVSTLLSGAEDIGDPAAVTACLLGLGQWAFWLGRTHEQREISERLLPRIDELRVIYRDWVASGLRTDAYWGATPIEEGLENLEAARRIVGDDVNGRLGCDVVEVGLLAMADRSAEADVLIDHLYRASEDHAGAQLFSGQIFAESLWRLGRREEAISALSGHKAYLDGRGETGVNSTVTAQLARYLAATGGLDEAERLIEEARSMGAADDFATRAEIGQATSIVAVARSDPEAALAAVEDAIESLRPTDYLMYTADALQQRGVILLAAGHQGASDASLREALALYDHKGAITSARRLRAWCREQGIAVP